MNLNEALHNVREPTRAIRLWVDAICINQGDVNEGDQQVALMGQIYSIANHTIICLGPSTPVISIAFRSAAGVERKVTSKKPISPEEDHSNDEFRETQMKRAAGNLLTRPWFTRTWVFQELILSRDPWVQCGKSRFSQSRRHWRRQVHHSCKLRIHYTRAPRQLF
jgi:Heterokaryon incompatibility protein (HET)